MTFEPLHCRYRLPSLSSFSVVGLVVELLPRVLLNLAVTHAFLVAWMPVILSITMFAAQLSRQLQQKLMGIDLTCSRSISLLLVSFRNILLSDLFRSAMRTTMREQRTEAPFESGLTRGRQMSYRSSGEEL